MELTGAIDHDEFILRSNKVIDLSDWPDVKDVGFEITDAGDDNVTVGNKKLLAANKGLYSIPGYELYSRMDRFPVVFDGVGVTPELRVFISFRRKSYE